MGPNMRAEHKARDKQNAPFRMTVEDTYGKHVNLWPHVGKHTVHSVFHNGITDWELVTDTWLSMTLFTNIHTCLYGSQATATFHIEPPSVSEYLANTNAGRMVTSGV